MNPITWILSGPFTSIAAIAAIAAASATIAAAQNSVCPAPDEKKIAFMGSSVCLGLGSSNAGGPFDYYQSFDISRKGYAFDYATLLNDRFKQGKGADWKVTNVSVSGNNTTQVLARWKKDLLPQCARYVVYGLSMANEGIMTDATAFDRFRTNMEKLIKDARDSGMVPLVVNNYANNDFSADIYGKIKSMDLLIHGWSVPTINVLGALDDGAGHWAPGYFTDAGHPNDKGYREMAASIVPSLFDALKDGKPRPTRKPAGFVKLGSGDRLGFQPEAGLRSFTLVVEVRALSTGPILEFRNGGEPGGIRLDPAGVPVYQSGPSGPILKGATRINDGAWHWIALTHYAATGRTLLYVDAVKQAGTAAETILNPADFKLGSARNLDSAEFRNLCFYRAGMTPEEMTAIKSGTLLQSSLEIYAPFEGTGTVTAASIANHAQGKNVLVPEPGPVSVIGKPRPGVIGDGAEAMDPEASPRAARMYDLGGRLLREKNRAVKKVVEPARNP